MEKISFAIIAIIAISFFSVNHADAKLYQNNEFGFSIDYPDTWDFDDTLIELLPNPGYDDGSFRIVSFFDDIKMPTKLIEIKLIKNETIAANFQGDDYFDHVIKRLQDNCTISSVEIEGYTCTHYSILNQKITKIDGYTTYQISDSWTENYPDEKFLRLQSILTDVIVGNDLWTIDSIATTQEAADLFTIMDSSVHSFQIIEKNQKVIPGWIRSNADWWSQGLISDDDFVLGIQFLLDKGIMKVPKTQTTTEPALPFLPNWIKDTAGWWATGKVTDDDFVNGIQYLIEHGIIKV